MISNRYKIPGFILILAGMALTAVYTLHRVDLTIPAFAVYSSYIETKYFSIIRTNFFEEVIFTTLFIGFILTSFSKERNEHEYYSVLRGKSWQGAILLNTAMLLFFSLFVFGRGFMMILIFNLFSVFIFYHVIFLVKKRKFDRMKAKTSGQSQATDNFILPEE
jgi:hypothetical protein